jgi:ribosomal protein L29
MSKTLSLAELRKMQEADLLKEITEQRRTVAKLRIDLERGKEKGSHLYQSAKKQLSRMLTVYAELRRSVLSELRNQSAEATLSAPAS